jgi:hypothetical protein
LAWSFWRCCEAVSIFGRPALPDGLCGVWAEPLVAQATLPFLVFAGILQ